MQELKIVDEEHLPLGSCTLESEIVFHRNKKKRMVGSRITIPEEFYKRYSDKDFEEVVVNEIIPYLNSTLRVVGFVFEQKGFIDVATFRKMLCTELGKDIL